MKTVKKILSILATISLVCAFTIPFASAATVKVYEKDIFLNDDKASNSGWKIIADDPGFYFNAAGEAVHKSPSLWSKTSQSDPKFSWKYDTSEFKNGSSSLSQTYSTGFFYYWLTEFSGKTLDVTNTQYLLMDLYIEDTAIFLNASDFRIDFTDSKDKNNLKWDSYVAGVSRDTLKATFLRKGWNSLKLYLGGTDGTDTINLKAITGVRFFAVGLSGGVMHTVKLDNVHLVSKKYTTQTATVSSQTSSKTATASVANNNTQSTKSNTVSIASAATASAKSTDVSADNGSVVSSAENPSDAITDGTDRGNQDLQTSGSSEETNTANGKDSKTNILIWLIPVIVGVAVIAGAATFIVLKRKKADK